MELSADGPIGQPDCHTAVSDSRWRRFYSVSGPKRSVNTPPP